MSQSLSLSKLEEPPLFLLYLAAISLMFNLCFPQYSAMAYSGKQEFDKTTSSNTQITLDTLKEEIEKTQNITQIVQTEEVFAELKLEKVTPKINQQTYAIKTVSQQTEPNTQKSQFTKVVTVTAYSSTVDQCDSSPFITASGTHVRDGIIATNALAFGTRVQFPSVFGDKVFVVEDRMNARYSDRADIWFSTREEAKQFGVKRLEMIVL